MPTQLRHPDLSPTMDLIAKKIFHKQHLTADFIRSVLNIPVVSVEILDGTQIQLAEYDHPNFYTAVDVCAKLEDGTQVIIEVQVTKQRSFFNRILAYLANQITDNLKRLKTDQNKTHTLYSKMDPVYCIAILEKEHFDDDRAFHTLSLYDEETLTPVYSDFHGSSQRPPMKFAFLELNKYNKDRITEYHLQKWFEFFSNKPFDIEMDPVIKEAEELLDQTQWTKEEKRMFDQERRNRDLYEGAIAQATYDGQQLGIKQGIEKGIQKSKTEMAKAMLKDKLDISFIVKYTGLTHQEIQQLAQTTHI